LPRPPRRFSVASAAVTATAATAITAATFSYLIMADFAEDPYSVRTRRNVKRPAPDVNSRFLTESKIRAVDDNQRLGYFSTRHATPCTDADRDNDTDRPCSALILNKQVGTGIFVAPPVVLAITGSKGMSLILWFVGGIVTWAGYTCPACSTMCLQVLTLVRLTVYLEYGLKFPLTGGELHYVR